MAAITFFRQMRADGGVRSGIDVDGTTVLERFEQGSRSYDPALVWYVDVRCTGVPIRDEPDAVRAWFIEHASLITTALQDLAGRIVGVDEEVQPSRWVLRRSPKGVRIAIVACAARRRDGRAMPRQLSFIAANWERLVDELTPLAQYH